MTAENSGYNGVCEESTGEFEEGKGVLNFGSQEDLEKCGGCNGIACGNGEVIDGNVKDDADASYVFVSSESDEISNNGSTVDGKVDPVGAAGPEPFVVENGVPLPNSSSLNEDKLVGGEVSHDQNGDRRKLILENGNDHEEVVTLNPEIDDQERGKESPPSGFVEVEYNGELGDEKGEIEGSSGEMGENGGLGEDNVHERQIGMEETAKDRTVKFQSDAESPIELVDKAEEKVPETTAIETHLSESMPFENVVVGMPNVADEIPAEEPFTQLERKQELNLESELEKEVKIGSQESGETMRVHCADSKAEVSNGPLSGVTIHSGRVDCVDSKADEAHCPKSLNLPVDDKKSIDATCSVENMHLHPDSSSGCTWSAKSIASCPADDVESETKLEGFSIEVGKSEPLSPENGTVSESEANSTPFENSSVGVIYDVEVEAEDGHFVTEANAGNDEAIEVKVGSVLVERGEGTTVDIGKNQPTNEVDSYEMVCKEVDDFKEDNKVDEATNDVPTDHADDAKLDSDAGSDSVALRDSEVYSIVENGSPHKRNTNIDMSAGENAVDSIEDTDKIACGEDSSEDANRAVETNKDASTVENIVASVVDDQSVSTDKGNKLVCEEAVKQADKDVGLQSPCEVSSTLALHDQMVEPDVKPLPSPSEDPSSSDLHDPEVQTDLKPLPSPSEDPSGSALHEQQVATDVKRLPCFIIRIPRFSDDKLKAQIHLAQQQVEEKTQGRDSIRLTLQKQKGVCIEYWEKFEAARKEERSARDAVVAKRQEMDSIQSTINKIKTANSVDDIDNRIHNLEHMMQHETIPLKEEKKLIREISQLKQNREQLSSNLASVEELEEAFDNRTQIEKRFELLKEDLDSLKKAVGQAELNTKAVRRKYDDENQLYRNLQVEFRAADDVRQEAYTHLRGLRKKSFEKNECFYTYKDDMKAASNYASSGDRERLQSHCSNQVEKVMDLWNKNDEFRKEYVKSNLISTLRRFRTLDGRSLAPDEEPTLLHNVIDEKLKNGPLPSSRTELAMSTPVSKKETLCQPDAPEKSGLEPPIKVIEKSQSTKSAKPTKGRDIIIATTVSGREEAEKEKKLTEEEELAKKEEELARKEEELKKEAELKERHRLEQIAKAKEAEERKRRKAEKDEAKAQVRAQREAEVREKKRAKKVMKKKKMTGPASLDTANGGSEAESVVSESTSSSQITQETEVKATASSKRASSTAVKNYKNKIKPLPLPLRNRSRRKMQTWMWVLLTVLTVLGLFLVGNYVPFSNFNLPGFGF